MIIHAGPARFVAQRFHVRAHFCAVFVTNVFGSNLDALLRFQIDQRGRLAEIGPNFLGIQNVKQDDLISVKAQRLDGADDLLGGFVKVGIKTTIPRRRRNC